MTDAFKIALDRFDVPSPSAHLADRIMAAATGSQGAPAVLPSRDRRGAWRRGRQVLLGSLAAGLLSAGAVASGLLGSVGIEVPVLTAMLAPKPAPVSKPAKIKPKQLVVRTAKPVPPLATEPPAAVVRPPLSPAERFARREERRERREAFAAAYPVAAAVIRERVQQELQRRAFARRQALTTPGIDPSLPGNQNLDPANRIALARAARRDMLVAERMIDRRIQAREARMAARADTIGNDLADSKVVEPTGQEMASEARAERRKRLQLMTPEERASVRERMQERRERRQAQHGQN